MSAMEKIQHKREAGDYSEGLVGLRKELGFYFEYNREPVTLKSKDFSRAIM